MTAWATARSDASERIEGRFWTQAAASAVLQSLPVKVANVNAWQVASGSPQAQGWMPDPKADKWLSFRIQQRRTENLSTGGQTRAVEDAGTILIECRTPIGKGEKDMDEMVGACREIYPLATDGPLVYREPTVGPGREINGWYKADVSVPFTYYFFV